MARGAQMYLFLDDSENSRKTKEKLEKTGVNLKVEYATGPNIPCVKIGNNSFFGSWGIQFVVDRFSQPSKGSLSDE